MSHKYVYLFSEGDATMRNLLGGKGANLAEMTNLGLPVPQGFTVTTEACTKYYEDGRVIAQEIVDQIHNAMSELEKIVGKKFGDVDNPFLVSAAYIPSISSGEVSWRTKITFWPALAASAAASAVKYI
jgi:pyruvate,orthophosphate dikinase